MFEFYTKVPHGHTLSEPTKLGRQQPTGRSGSLNSVLYSIVLLTFLGTLILVAGNTTFAQTPYFVKAGGGLAPQDGSNWEHASPTIPSFPVANTNIYVAAGSYSPTQNLNLNNDNSIIGGFPATNTGLNVSNYDPIANQTTISISVPLGTFITSNGGSASKVVEVKGLKFSGGNRAFDGPNGSGNMTGTFKFTDCSFTTMQNGLAFQKFINGQAIVTNCYFTACNAGAINTSTAQSTASFLIQNSNFYDNDNNYNGGGAISAGSIDATSDHGSITILNSTFCENSASQGGAIWNYPYTTDALFTVTGCTFSKNYTTSASGGAIYMNANVNMKITSSKFYENTAFSHGGAIAQRTAGTAGFVNEITDCVFYKNKANADTYGSPNAYGNDNQTGGGALALNNTFDGYFCDIKDSKFVGNSLPNATFAPAGPLGAAICHMAKVTDYAAPSINITNSLFYGNLRGTTSDDVKNTHARAVSPIHVSGSTMQLPLTSYDDPSDNYFGPGITMGVASNVAPISFSGSNTFSNTTDNGGVTAPTYTCPGGINAVAVTIQGQVWNDADGSITLNGSETGTNAGGPLYVNLVDATGTVVASTTVSATGSYALTAPASTTGLKLTLSTSATATTPGPLPTGWVNTGENQGSGNSATQSATVGQIELATGTGAVTGASFGIEQTPTAGSGTATVSNSGGTSPVTVPPSAFTSSGPSTDTPPGSVTAIRLTVFPTNVTSLTINGTVYSSLPGGGIVVPTDGSEAPTVPILIDPTNDSSPVSFSFVAVDNAGKESTTTGTATLNSTLTTTVSGQVWDDVNGDVTLDGSENGTNVGGPLYVNLVDGTGTIVASTTVSVSGSYTLSGVPTNVTGYKLVLTNTATANTPGPLPVDWVNTGEIAGSGNSASQSSTVGQIELTTTTSAVSGANFGIEHLPTPGSGTATVSNAGGTSPVTVPPSAFTSTSPANDNGDTPPGSVTAIKINTFPSNVTSLTINGTVYTSIPAGGITIPTDGSGAPTVPILIDPTNDTQPVVITYTAIDNAGQEATNTGTATITSVPAPDLVPTIYARPNTLKGLKPITIVVDVLELKGGATSGTITVRVSKDSHISLSPYDGSASSVDGRVVQNSSWAFSEDATHYLFTSQAGVVIPAYGQLSFGVVGSLDPAGTSGSIPVSVVIEGGSGGEVKTTNNTDADVIDYFQQ